jgi:hypothetical protein
VAAVRVRRPGSADRGQHLRGRNHVPAGRGCVVRPRLRQRPVWVGPVSACLHAAVAGRLRGVRRPHRPHLPRIPDGPFRRRRRVRNPAAGHGGGGRDAARRSSRLGRGLRGAGHGRDRAQRGPAGLPGPLLRARLGITRAGPTLNRPGGRAQVGLRRPRLIQFPCCDVSVRLGRGGLGGACVGLGVRPRRLGLSVQSLSVPSPRAGIWASESDDFCVPESEPYPSRSQDRKHVKCECSRC